MRKALVFQRHSVLTFTTGSYDGVDMHPGSSYSGSRAATAAARRQPPPPMTATAAPTVSTHTFAPTTPPLNTTPSPTASAGHGPTVNVNEQPATSAASVRATMQDLAHERANTDMAARIVADAQATFVEQAKAELQRMEDIEKGIMSRLDSALSTTHTSQQHTHHTNTHTHTTHTMGGPSKGQSKDKWGSGCKQMGFRTRGEGIKL